jgi:CBS domain-containing protein
LNSGPGLPCVYFATKSLFIDQDQYSLQIAWYFFVTLMSKEITMKVEELMTSKVEAVSPTTTLRGVAREMKDKGVGALPVVEDGKVIGIITDRDVSVYAIAMGHDPQTTEVQKVMTKQVYTCNAEQDISEAAKIMEQNKIRRLTVMNSEEDLAGFLSVDDLALVSGELAGAVLEAAIPVH